jgi:hypothetical protein
VLANSLSIRGQWAEVQVIAGAARIARLGSSEHERLAAPQDGHAGALVERFEHGGAAARARRNARGEKPYC